MYAYLYSVFKNSKNKFLFFLSINWVSTLYFNFKMLPFSIAKKLPVVFYGKVKFTSLNGKVIINAPIRFRMVGFGENLEMIKRNFNKAELKIDGFFHINGNFSTGNDYVICINKDAILEIGEGTYLGSNTKIITTKKVNIGKYFRFGYESQISDSNYHYILDYETKKVRRIDKAIIIGDYCWIGNRSTIMRGTVTPKNLIVASNSLLNRDYTLDVEENSVIGGMPAKLIKKGVSRIFDAELESKIHNYFKNNADQEYFCL